MLSVELDSEIVASTINGRLRSTPVGCSAGSILRVPDLYGHLSADEGQPVLDRWWHMERRGARIGEDAGLLAAPTISGGRRRGND